MTTIHDVTQVSERTARWLAVDTAAVDALAAGLSPAERLTRRADRLDAWPVTRSASLPLLLWLEGDPSADHVRALASLSPIAFTRAAMRVHLFSNVAPALTARAAAWGDLAQEAAQQRAA